MENKLLTETKDEYAREQTYKTVEGMRHFSGWGDFWVYCNGIGVSKGSRLKEAIDTIATRYAAKQAKAFSEWLDKNQFHMNKWGDWDNGKTLMTTETAYRIFEKETAQYDNQNTDV